MSYRPEDPMPPGCKVVTEGSIEIPDARIEVRSYQWNEAQDVVFSVRDAYLDLALTGRPPECESSIVSPVPAVGGRLGKLVFSPPGHRFHGRWNAARRRSVCCMINLSAFAGGEPGAKLPAMAASLDMQNAFVQEAMLLLAREALNPGPRVETFARAIVCAITMELLNDQQYAIGNDHPSGPIRDTGLVRLLDARIHESTFAEIDLADIARERGVSPQQLLKTFRATTGLSLPAYTTLSRIRRAKASLALERTPIKRIAHDCGFRSVAAFSVAFRRETGMTPGSYRQLAIR